jgi:amidase
MTKTSKSYSRREFFRGGAAGIVTSALAISDGKCQSPAHLGEAPPPLGNGPRTLPLPSIEELQRIASGYRMDLSAEDLSRARGLMEGAFASYRRMDQFVEPTLKVKYPRDAGYRPSAAENRLNAWYWKSSIKGAPSGGLVGKRIAVKDNVCVAGIPMMIGSNVMEGYVPDVDATVVTRILDAGGEIAGKSVCDPLCFSGISDTGPVLNPHDARRSAGGSSSGSAALVVAGECDMALGADQGGSIRIPSSYCGACGIKPTYGLVPYSGIFPIEMTLDHVGPMAKSAAGCALLLEAIAGPDGFDPRQPTTVRTDTLTNYLTGHARGLRIGIVQEGFGWPGISEADVDMIVREAVHRLTRAGATVKEISIPLHREGPHIFAPIFIEGATTLLMEGNAMGSGWKGYYATSLMDFFARSRQIRANDLSDMIKLVVLLGRHMHDRYQGHYYAKAQNLVRMLRAAYDQAFKEVDLLAMPTTPTKAMLIPQPSEDYVSRAGASGMAQNTCSFNATGHPAMSVPCGNSQGLPVGMMLIGRFWEDGTVLRVADAFEQVK